MKSKEELEKIAQRIITEHTAATITETVEISLNDIPKIAAELVKNIAYEPVLPTGDCSQCKLNKHK